MDKKLDLRVIKTRQNIKQTFIKLLSQKKFKDITVQNIIDVALINRSTFYAHYCDKYDLLEQIVNELSGEFQTFIRNRFLVSSFKEFKSILISTLVYLSKDKDVILALWSIKTEETDLFKRMTRLLVDECYIFTSKLIEENKFVGPQDYFCSLYSSIVMTTLQWWFTVDNKYDETYLSDLVSNIASNGMFHAFLKKVPE